MSSDLPTMGDMIDPDKNVQPVTENSTKKESPKKAHTDNTKEKGNSDKKKKEKRNKEKEGR